GKKVLDIGEDHYEIRQTEFKQGRIFEGTIIWIVNTSEQTKLVLQEELNLRTEETLHETVTVLAAAVDAKDRYTNGHSLRVAQYARMIALRMGKSEEYAKNIYLHAILHDVGKIGIPDEIINKVGKLTDEEYNTIKTHSKMGYDILSEITSHPTLAQAARWHHERYDGKGYPDGLKGEEIPEFARIIAVADAYDAMSSNRSYRNYMTQEKIISEFERGRGTQFDPEIADIWLTVMKEDINYILREHPENK
ncbi:MAG: HD-GYP domain-containing protein, partial [Erysipelotrichaceae bacterium]|nr:HD-GYP domain-containing protein [Erysipelotrichaceae bacterium]